MRMEVEYDQSGLDRGWYVYCGKDHFLHVDGVIRKGIKFNNRDHGFWPTKSAAQEACQAYVEMENYLLGNN